MSLHAKILRQIFFGRTILSTIFMFINLLYTCSSAEATCGLQDLVWLALVLFCIVWTLSDRLKYCSLAIFTSPVEILDVKYRRKQCELITMFVSIVHTLKLDAYPTFREALQQNSFTF
jgi:hypothetical protein